MTFVSPLTAQSTSRLALHADRGKFCFEQTLPVPDGGGARQGSSGGLAQISDNHAGSLAHDGVHFSGRLPQALRYSSWAAEHQKWFPRQKMRVLTALEGLSNKIRTWVAGCMIALASVIPMPDWLLKRICRAYFYSPRRVLNPLRLKDMPGESLNSASNGARETLNRSILSNSFQIAPGTSNLNTIHSFYLNAEPGKPTIVFSHGRDTNIGHLGGLFQGAKNKGYGFFAYDYPGFGRSEGYPDEKTLEEAGVAACRFLSGDSKYGGAGYQVPYNQQILMGYSLGGAVAVKVARRLEQEAGSSAATRANLPQQLILVNTFTDIKSAFQIQFNRFHKKIAQWFDSSRTGLKFDTLNTIQEIHRMPIMVVHCDNDPVVHFCQGEQLHQVVRGTKEFVKTKGTGHKFNKPYQLEDVIQHARNFGIAAAEAKRGAERG